METEKFHSSSQQAHVIVSFMEKHGDQSNMYGPQSEPREQLWTKLVNTLNSVPGGFIKTMPQWKKTWSNLKYKTRKKAKHVKILSPLEKRILKVIAKSTVEVCATSSEEEEEVTERFFEVPVIYEPDLFEPSKSMEVKDGGEPSDTSTAVDSNTVQEKEPPIIRLFKCLILNDKEKNTMVTNAQLIEILQSEYKLDISTLHELEVDIYLSVIKKFLLHWPQWDDFDREVNRLKMLNAMEEIEKVLLQKYTKLKDYLWSMIEVAKGQAQRLVKSIKENDNQQEALDKSKKSDSQKESVVMEIYCNRNQLHKLIQRCPMPDANTVFNTTAFPTRINFKKYDLKTILRYWNVKINVIAKDLSFTYMFNQNLQHTLVNKKHTSQAYERTSLNDTMQKRCEKKVTKAVSVADLCHVMSLLKLNAQTHTLGLKEELLEIFKMDFGAYENIEIPGRYKRYISKYPYVRYLHMDMESVETGKYDLQLEEVISPSVLYTFNNIEKWKANEPILGVSVNVECTSCDTAGKAVMACDLVEHFNLCHSHEKEMVCTNCSHKLDVFQIGQKGWCHEC